MKRNKRLLSAFLALVMLLSLLPAPLASAAGTGVYNGTEYSTDYTTWRQGDPAWGETPLGDVHTFAGSGCLISAIAILMCHSGAYNPASLNPGVLRDWFDLEGYISHSENRGQDALLSFGLMTRYTSPRFYFTEQEFFSTATPFEEVRLRVAELLASGYYVVARVNNSGHFVAVNSTVEGDVRIFDAGYNAKKLLSEYNGTIGGLLCFKANPSGEDTILPDLAAPASPNLHPMSDTWGTGDSIPMAWDSAELATHYNIYVDQQQADGTWVSNVQTHFYCKSPFTLTPLPAGDYRVKVQAANSKNWTYANSDYETFTVKSGYLTVFYDAAGGQGEGEPQFVKPGAPYTLTTPTKEGAAFLGWYTEDGKLLNHSSTVTTSQGHTVTAQWDEGAAGFRKAGSYDGSFRDVSRSAWYYDNIALIYGYGLMNGVEPTLFHPDDQITTAQAVTLAARMRKLYLTGDGSFPSSDPWYKTYGDYAVSQGVLSSVPPDMDAPLTRQEFAAILANALPAEALPAVNTIETGSIPDVYRSDSAIYKLYRAGIFAGSDAQGTFRPNDPISRAEVATVLVRMADPNVRVLFTLP